MQVRWFLNSFHSLVKWEVSFTIMYASWLWQWQPCPQSLRGAVGKTLGMDNPVKVTVSPDKTNLFFFFNGTLWVTRNISTNNEMWVHKYAVDPYLLQIARNLSLAVSNFFHFSFVREFTNLSRFCQFHQTEIGTFTLMLIVLVASVCVCVCVCV